MCATNARCTREELPDDDGQKMWHLKMSMPMVISNRSVITTFYQNVDAEGWTSIFHSSQGNEAQTTAREAEIGSDVIANNIIVYTAFKPYEGGVEFK